MRISPILRSRVLTFRPLPSLPDTSVATFRKQAFAAEVPYLLPRGALSSLPAIRSWFNHPSSESEFTTLRESALEQYAETLVTTELTIEGTFRRHPAPLGVWLAWAVSAQDVSDTSTLPGRLTIAQASLSELPEGMRAAVPTPDLVRDVGKGDVYDASLWMGVAPTVTPLHRDPNPNVLAQLAGRKRIRILNPAKGQDVWRAFGAKEGAEGMMFGQQRKGLEKAMWTAKWAAEENEAEGDGWEGEIEAGDAVFIPKGWWHAVHGVGKGITASVNWWFR